MPARRNNQGSKPPRALVPFDDTETARTALKTILVARNITYAQLAELLAAQGVQETETSIAHKIRRGTFQLSFMYQCMRAIGVSQLVLDIPTQRSPDVARA
jgi:Domain of unknown function (DUF6471)